MSTPAHILLGRYHYTALDKLAACTLGAQPSAQRFYLKERLSTEIQGTLQHSIMQHEDQLLAQQQHQAGKLRTQLLATDQQRSVLALLDATRVYHLGYSPYGHRGAENGLLSLLGFNGERPDPLTGWYFLGNGYRAFNPVLMRFNIPDSWSPFGEGGLNAYGYCVGDPINRVDPTGHMLKGILKIGRRGSDVSRRVTTQAAPLLTTSADDLARVTVDIEERSNWLTKQWNRIKPNKLEKLDKSIIRARNKLTKAENKLQTFEESSEHLINKYIIENEGLFSPDFLESNIRSAVPARRAELTSKVDERLRKLDKLKTKASTLRQE